ncbi:MAG: peptidoglycan DD-metalloendopeptidase family protein [Deltaproteobacteria bacterium]|nr:peptidoglycan DD-metalloendopeptidase family protein [Deltaproteobacteria bacterium]
MSRQALPPAPFRGRAGGRGTWALGMSLLLVVGVVGPGGAWGQQGKATRPLTRQQQELRRLKKEIEGRQEKLKATTQRESGVIAELHQTEQVLRTEQEALAQVQARLAEVGGRLTEGQVRLQVLRTREAALRRQLRERLAARYKFGEAGTAQLFFSAASYSELAQRQKFMEIILQHDRALLDAYEREAAALQEVQQGIARTHQDLDQLSREREARRRAVARERTRKLQILRAVRREKEVHLAALKGLEEAARDLQGLIKKLEEEARRRALETPPPQVAGKGFSAWKGALSYPVRGRVLSPFGRREDPTFGTVTFQKGIEIAAPLGAEVRAVFSGRVLYADWFKGYGKMLIIDHGGHYYTLMAHASQLLKRAGDTVRKGEVVALVGDTGSINGPKLYFEIRYFGTPMDPLEWLRQAGAGAAGVAEAAESADGGRKGAHP